MKLKRQKFNCAGCAVSISLPYPTCQGCDRQTEAVGDKFFDYVSIHNLRRSRQYDADEDRRYYVFSLSVGGFLINGNTYNASNGSVKFPSNSPYGKKTRYVSAHGMTIRRVRAMLVQQISQLEGDESGKLAA